MIKSHKIKLLQCLSELIEDNVKYCTEIMNCNFPSDNDLESVDSVLTLVLEQVALFRATYAELFKNSDGIRIKD